MNRAAFQNRFRRDPDEAWFVKKLADVLEVGEDVIYEAIKSGFLPHYRVGSRIRMFGGDIADWLEVTTVRCQDGRMGVST